MHRWSLVGIAAGIAVLACVLLACATKGLRYTRLPIDPRWALVYVKNDSELRFDPDDDTDSKALFTATGDILLPRCSPDGKQLAYYTFNERRGQLNVVPVTAFGDSAASEKNVLAEIDSPVGHRITVFPAIWESNGASLLVVSQSGIHRIATDRGHKQLVAHEGIIGAAVSPDETRIAYADGLGVTVVDTAGEPVASIRTASPSNPNRQETQPLAFSPDGGRIAYAAGRYLYIWALASNESTEIQDMADPVFWIGWLPGQERLVFTIGKAPRALRSSPGALPYATDPGYYAMYSIKTDGHGLKFVFKGREMDAHLADPTLSPDGRHVALVLIVDERPRVMIVATDATKATPLTEEGASSNASWIPVPIQPAGSAPQPCRTAVFYPRE